MGKITDRVYAELRSELLSGLLAPGMQLKEEALASQYGVSRTPIRAALQRLLADGLVEMSATGRAIVTTWTTRDIEELFTLRILLEGQAAASAALRASDAQIRELSALTEEMARQLKRKSPDYQGKMQAANKQFHQLLLEASGSPRLRQITSTLVDFPLTAFYIYQPDEIIASVQHHRELVRALSEREPDLARRIMEVHLSAAQQAFRRSRRQSQLDNPKLTESAEVLISHSIKDTRF